MTCPRDAIGNAIKRCPFLQQVSTDQGEEYARKIATRPSVPASAVGPRPVFEERSCDFEATLRLFHGATGVVPLKKVAASIAAAEQLIQPTPRSLDAVNCRSPTPTAQYRADIATAPFASMSMAGAFNFLVCQEWLLQPLQMFGSAVSYCFSLHPSFVEHAVMWYVTHSHQRPLQPGPHDVANILFGKKGPRGKNIRKPGHSSSSSRSSSKGPVAGKATAATQQSGQCPLRKFPGAQVCNEPAVFSCRL